MAKIGRRTFTPGDEILEEPVTYVNAPDAPPYDHLLHPDRIEA